VNFKGIVQNLNRFNSCKSAPNDLGQKDVGLYGPSGAKVSTKIGTSLSSLGLKNSKLRHGFFISANGFWTEPLGSNESRPG